jgi:hypothetical protein
LAFAAVPSGTGGAADAVPLAGRRAEELIGRGAIGLVALRDVGGTIAKLEDLGATRILRDLGVPRMVKGRVDQARMKIGEGLAALGLTIDDLVRTFQGSAFVALFDVVGVPPQIPHVLVWTEIDDDHRPRIEGVLNVLANLGMGGVGGQTGFQCRGVSVGLLAPPGAQFELCWAFVGGGFAFSIGRVPIEDFITRLDDARGKAPAAGALCEAPAVDELLARVGAGEDVVAFLDVEALFARLGDRIPPQGRQRLEALGLGAATIGYALKVSPRIAGVRPGGVKEAIVVSSARDDGVLRAFNLPKLGMDDIAAMARDLVGLRVAFDAHNALEVFSDAARALGNPAAAERIAFALAQVAQRFQVEAGSLLDAASGRLTMRVAERRASLVPDATLAFASNDPQSLGSIVETLIAHVGPRLKHLEFEGRSLYAFEPDGEKVPALLSPGASFDGSVLTAALSTQALKRAVRNGATHTAPAVATTRSVPATAGVLMELSPQPSIALSLDVPRIAAIVFDIVSVAPERYSHKVRGVVAQLPPVEDLLDDICGAAMAVYGNGASVAIESFSPTGHLPMFAALAVASANKDARARQGAGAAGVPRDEKDPWDDGVRF